MNQLEKSIAVESTRPQWETLYPRDMLTRNKSGNYFDPGVEYRWLQWGHDFKHKSPADNTVSLDKFNAVVDELARANKFIEDIMEIAKSTSHTSIIVDVVRMYIEKFLKAKK